MTRRPLPTPIIATLGQATPVAALDVLDVVRRAVTDNVSDPSDDPAVRAEQDCCGSQSRAERYYYDRDERGH